MPRALVLCMAILAIAACSPPATVDAGDASTDATRDGQNQDVPQDTEPPIDHAPFGSCYADADCPSGWNCVTNLQGMPRGFCTKSCSADTDCEVDATMYRGVTGVCGTISGNRSCVRQCLNGLDCGREGYTCVDIHPISRLDPTALAGECAPTCDDTNCGIGAVCDRWTGRCQAPTAPLPPPGQDLGGPCTMSGMNSECRSQDCIRPVSMTGLQPTGWNGGGCVGTCALPAGFTVSDFWMPSMTLPQANCPAGGVCIPASGDEAERDWGNCLEACTADADCRASEGYFCHRTVQLGGPGHMRIKTYTNGWCEPVDCVNDSHHPCPTGYSCHSLIRDLGEGQTETYGRCAPATPGDGGADGSTDSGSDAAADAGADGATDAAADAGAEAGTDASGSDAAADGLAGLDVTLDV